MLVVVLQRLILEGLFDIIYFPVWWYTRGTLHALRWTVGLFKRGNAVLAPGLWLANLFVPMFGQYDFVGRIISFFMRSFQVFIRSIAMLFWLIICLFLFCIWLVLPVAVIYGFSFVFKARQIN
jgi:hypothetical protein